MVNGWLQKSFSYDDIVKIYPKVTFNHFIFSQKSASLHVGKQIRGLEARIRSSLLEHLAAIMMFWQLPFLQKVIQRRRTSIVAKQSCRDYFSVVSKVYQTLAKSPTSVFRCHWKIFNPFYANFE